MIMYIHIDIDIYIYIRVYSYVYTHVYVHCCSMPLLYAGYLVVLVVRTFGHCIVLRARVGSASLVTAISACLLLS